MAQVIILIPARSPRIVHQSLVLLDWRGWLAFAGLILSVLIGCGIAWWVVAEIALGLGRLVRMALS